MHFERRGREEEAEAVAVWKQEIMKNKIFFISFF